MINTSSNQIKSIDSKLLSQHSELDKLKEATAHLEVIPKVVPAESDDKRESKP